MLTTLSALQQADSAFPSGNFAFSNGMEGIAALNGAFDVGAARLYVEATLRHRWVGADRVALLHAFDANVDLDRLALIDRAIEAATLAEPLRLGSRRAGRALLVSHVRLGTFGAEVLRTSIDDGCMLGHQATVQGCLWRSLGLSRDQVAAISGYQLVTGMVGAAVRLGRIGALDAQAIVRDVLPIIADLLRDADPLDSETLDLQSFVPLAEIASMRGMDAKLRLFSN